MVLAVALTFSLCSCQKEKEAVIDEFVVSIGTKSSEPLVGTVWENEMVGEYNLYLSFEREGRVSVFYGMVDEEEGLQRWSDFPDGTYEVDGGKIIIDASYPSYGETLYLNTIGMAKLQDEYTLVCNDNKVFKYFGKDIPNLDSIWMTIDVSIKPWQ